MNNNLINKFLNIKCIKFLLITCLLLVVLFLFTKVAYLFEPIGQFIAVTGMPIIVSGILYYFLVPIVDYLEKRKVPRIWGIILLFAIIIAVLIWGAIIAVPNIQYQTMSLINNWPYYWDTIVDKSQEFLRIPIINQFSEQLQTIGNNLSTYFGSFFQSISGSIFTGVGNFFGTVVNVVVTVVTTPIILFYLLKDGRNLAPYVVEFLPTHWRYSTMTVLSDMNRQVAQYMRGQVTVAFSVAIMFMLGFKIIGLDYAVTLGILAGFLNLIPYLGSFLATIPALFLAIVSGPMMLLKVIIVFMIEQTFESRIISPLVLGSKLNIHPITIVFVLLTSGKIFGIVGFILGVPFYAAIKVIVTHIFEWYKDHSPLYTSKDQ